MNDILWTVVVALLPLVVSAAAWGIRKLKIDADFQEALVAFFHRGVTKFGVCVEAARRADSDGGATITAAEASRIRQDMLDLLMSELRGPLAAVARARGEAWIKGVFGGWLDAWMAKKGIKLG